MMTCPICDQPIDLTQPTATTTALGRPWTMCAPCGRHWKSELRQHHLVALAQANGIRRQIDSLRIVPAQETADDGLTFDSHGELVAGWAY